MFSLSRQDFPIEERTQSIHNIYLLDDVIDASADIHLHLVQLLPSTVQGRIQDFHLGRWSAKCARTHITSTEPNSLSAGVQGPLKGPGRSRVVLMLSRAIWALFWSILILKIGFKKHSWSNFRGRAPVAPLLGSAPAVWRRCHKLCFTWRTVKFKFSMWI